MYQRILVPYDGSPPSRIGLAEALEISRQTGAKVCVVHVIDELLGATGFEPYAVYAQDVLTRMRKTGMSLLEEARAQAETQGLTIETRLAESGGHQLVDRMIDQARAWRADLIVIGSHGRRGAAHLFMGSDAEHLMRLAPIPVLIVKPAEAAQPA